MDFIYHGKRVRESSGLEREERPRREKEARQDNDEDRGRRLSVQGAFLGEQARRLFHEPRGACVRLQNACDADVGEDLLAWQARRETAGSSRQDYIRAHSVII